MRGIRRLAASVKMSRIYRIKGMSHIITEIVSYDNRRNRVTLDYGEVTFLLYKGECRKAGLKLTEETYAADGQEPIEISDESYRDIMDNILLPRAKKRIMYYLKNADKTRQQIKRKLKEGYYPDEIIEDVFIFLDRYGFANDERYTESFVEELRCSKSKREISMKLMQRGISRSESSEIIAGISDEDESFACERAIIKKYPKGLKPNDRRNAYAYLARRGFAYDVIEHAVNALTEET